MRYDDAVENLCRQLDGRERRILELSLDGCDTAEIAAELEVETNVIRVYRSRLRQRLRASGVMAELL